MSAYEYYRLQLAKLRQLASRRDFSPDGDAAYYRQFLVVKEAYHVACTLPG